MKKDSFGKPWAVMAQKIKKYYRSPGRPTPEEIAIYRSFCKKIIGNKKGAKALVLGATPQLRDMLSGLKCRTTLVDINPEMVHAMTTLLKRKPYKKEIKRRGNWLDTKLPEKSFDIIVGDAVIGNVGWEQQDKMLEEMRRILKGDGAFITRVEAFPEKWKNSPFEKVFGKFKRKKKSMRSAMELFIELMYNVHDVKKRKNSTALVFGKIREYYNPKKGNFLYPDKKISWMLNQTHQLWKPYNKEWSIGTKKEIEEKIRKYFKIKGDKFSPLTNTGKCWPIFLLQKK